MIKKLGLALVFGVFFISACSQADSNEDKQFNYFRCVETKTIDLIQNRGWGNGLEENAERVAKESCLFHLD
jgi:hypothetical protein